MEVEETCLEHRNVHVFKTWLGRHKPKRECNQDLGNILQKNNKNSLSETFVSLPLCILNTSSSSSDDVQKLWRFANIIENIKETQVLHVETRSNGDLNDSKIMGNLEEKPLRSCREGTSNIEHSSPNYEDDGRHGNQKITDIFKHDDNESESIGLSMNHSSECEFYETPHENDEKHKLNKIETTIHHMNKKLISLEKKMDTILDFLELKQKRDANVNDA